MPQDEVFIRPRSVDSTLVLRISGMLAGNAVQVTAGKLADITSTVPSAACIVLDLRKMRDLSAAGARMMHDFVRQHAVRGVVSVAVLGPDAAITTGLRVAITAAELPAYETVDAAVANESRHDESARLGDQLSALTRVLLDATTIEQTLRQITAASIVVIPHTKIASVTLCDPAGRFFTPVQTDDVATELDQVQYATGAGPCVDVASADGPGYALDQDLTTASAWPRFAATAVRNGLGSVLSTALQPAGGEVSVRGALNIYSHRDAITEDDRHRALLLATHASLALARSHADEVAALHSAQLRRAIDSRDVIGQAKGILITRQGLTADEAFALLRRTSQDLNVKLADIAGTLAGRHTDLGPPPT